MVAFPTDVGDVTKGVGLSGFLHKEFILNDAALFVSKGSGKET